MVEYQLWSLGTCLFLHYMPLQADKPMPVKYLDIDVIQTNSQNAELSSYDMG